MSLPEFPAEPMMSRSALPPEKTVMERGLDRCVLELIEGIEQHVDLALDLKRGVGEGYCLVGDGGLGASREKLRLMILRVLRKA